MEHENTILLGDCLNRLKEFPDNSIDQVVTDPPYGYSFMGKDWDKAVPSVEVWQECLRVLKPGGFAFVMSAPRQDVLSQMIVRIGAAGFDTNFTSIYWTYASGFPKAMNIGKMVDKRADYKLLSEYRRAFVSAVEEAGLVLPGNSRHDWTKGEHAPGNKWWTEFQQWLPTLKTEDRERVESIVVGKGFRIRKPSVTQIAGLSDGEYDITAPSTADGQALDGSYGGFQPKPAVEVIIVAMKPLSEKTFVDQALKNGKGITWLDDARIPFEDTPNPATNPKYRAENGYKNTSAVDSGSVNYKLRDEEMERNVDPSGRFPANLICSDDVLNDHSRFFSLDKWAEKTLPFLIVPKPSKAEKAGTKHPTVKPVRLMSYLITLGSRPGDLVLDPFVGSGTTCVAAKLLGRRYLGIERDGDYYREAVARVANTPQPLAA